jgi:TolB-like protein
VDLAAQLQDTLGSTLVIERELGGGGMARVFVARDVALGRRVVVKVLPPETGGGVNIDRFKREIALAARLQHPHIVPLLTSGEMHGVPYFTMPFVEGESLRARLSRHGELPLAEAARVLREIASALAYAHEQGVVHRDIKPDNVLMSGGSAMVTDFGVAKALSASSNSECSGVTSLGVALGTPAYMSPEQATADPAIDHRADIYAFGVTAYELLTGQAPFGGRTPQALLAAHVMETPEPITRRRQSIPAPLGALVMRCLEKRPADRPQSAIEVVRALDAIATPSGGLEPTAAVPSMAAPPRWHRTVAIVVALTAIAGAGAVWWTARGSHASPSNSNEHSLAVMPFQNAGRDTSGDYFADGMTDELTAALGKIPGVRLAGRAAVFQLRDKQADPQALGTRLHVGALLVGTVSRSGTQMRVTAQLLNAADGLSLWSDRYTGDVKNVFAVQDSIARAIASAMKLALAPPEPAGSASRTQSVEAHDLYLKGTFYEHQYTEASIRQAIDLFQQAAVKDPKYASPWAGLALAWLNLSDDWVPPREGEPRAQEAARHALELDSTNADAHAVLALTIAAYDWDVPRALVEARRALTFDAKNLMANTFVAIAADAATRINVLRKSAADNPGNSWATGFMTAAFLAAKQLDSARAWIARERRGDTPNLLVLRHEAILAAAEGRCADALRMLDEARANGRLGADTRVECDIKLGNRAAALAVVNSLIAQRRRQYLDAFNIVRPYVKLGDMKAALNWADTAFADHSPAFGDPRVLQESYPELLRQPRFQVLMEKASQWRLAHAPDR